MQLKNKKNVRNFAFWGKLAILYLTVSPLAVAEFVDSVDALYEAAEGGNTGMVERLIAEGVDVNAQSSGGSYPLNGAATTNYQDTLRRLLTHGANPNARNQGGETPLICATKYGGGKAATIRLLLESGADPRIADNDGGKALAYAVRKGQGPAIQLLERVE